MYSALFTGHGRQECSFYEIHVISSPNFSKLLILLDTWHIVDNGFQMHKLYIGTSDEGKVRKLSWFYSNNHSSISFGVRKSRTFCQACRYVGRDSKPRPSEYKGGMLKLIHIFD